MGKKLVNCKSCSKEVAKSAKKCPHCGEKLKSGLFAKLIAFIFVLVVLGIVFGPSEEEKADAFKSTLDAIASAPPANISPTGELASIFEMGSDFTDIQRENKENELKGQVVQWTLPVYEVSKVGEKYRVQTSGGSSAFGGVPLVGTFLNMYPQNAAETKYIESLKTGDKITIKGKITGTSMRNIVIDPATLVSQ